MAWVEQSGKQSWRVRWHAHGHTDSVSGFRSERDAHAYVADMATDRRRGTWIDPVADRMLLAVWVVRWLAALDLDERTLESYRSRLRCHILPRFGTTHSPPSPRSTSRCGPRPSHSATPPAPWPR